MVQRNERDAIIQHGTMTLVRRAAIDHVGRWAEWCICEDAEMGLRLLAGGWHSVYTDRRYGYGLTPDRSEEHTSELQSLMRTSYTVFCLKNKQSLDHTVNIT